MHTFDRYTEIRTAGRDARANHHTLLSVVLPRPIAFVSTRSKAGVNNLAPFSYFNGICSNPPAVLFCPAVNQHGREKDSLINLRDTGECVINTVPYAIREAMNQASFPYPPETSEFDAAGFTPIPSKMVAPPRVAQSPAHLECKLIEIVKVGQGPLSGNVCICEVLCFHVAEELCTPGGEADADRIDLIARLGGDLYCRMTERFEIPKPRKP